MNFTYPVEHVDGHPYRFEVMVFDFGNLSYKVYDMQSEDPVVSECPSYNAAVDKVRAFHKRKSQSQFKPYAVVKLENGTLLTGIVTREDYDGVPWIRCGDGRRQKGVDWVMTSIRLPGTDDEMREIKRLLAEAKDAMKEATM